MLAPDMLSELTTIKWLLIGVLVTLILVCILFLLMVGSFVNVLRNTANAGVKRDFANEAEELLDCGRFKELQILCEKRIETHKFDLWAKLYLAKAEYKLGKLGHALATLGEIKESDPGWEPYTVNSYIEEIQDQMSGPKDADA